MRFVFADSLDFVDPAYDFATDRYSVRGELFIATINFLMNIWTRCPTTVFWCHEASSVMR